MRHLAMRPLFEVCKQASRDDRGVAAVEMAMLSPVLVVMVLGVIDLSLRVWTYARVLNAANAGIEYAAINGYNSTAIDAAVKAATTASVSVTAPAPTYGCPTTNGSLTSEPSATSLCSDGAAAGTYVTVTASDTFTTFAPVLWGGSTSVTLTATAVTRTK
jgi:Flp pilus assembly protein TadG